MNQIEIDAMRLRNHERVERASAAVQALSPGARLTDHLLGPAEWYEVRSKDNLLLGEADASTVVDGDATAWENALYNLNGAANGK